MVFIKWAAITLLVLVLLLLIAGQLGMLTGKTPKDLGVTEGKLKRPSKTSNSVSSQADLWPDHPQHEYARIAAFTLRGDGPATLARIKAIAESWPRAVVVEASADYLYVQFSTALLKFTDDAEFWFDRTAGVVHVRSASRLGRKDFEVNRQRMEAIRAQLDSN